MFPPLFKINWKILMLLECLFVVGSAFSAHSTTAGHLPSSQDAVLNSVDSNSSGKTGSIKSATVSSTQTTTFDVSQESETKSTEVSATTGTAFGSSATSPRKESTSKQASTGTIKASSTEKDCKGCEILYSEVYSTTKKTSIEDDEQTDKTTGSSMNPSPTKSSSGTGTDSENSTATSPPTTKEGKVYNTIYDYFIDNPPTTRHQKKVFEIQKGLGEKFRLKWTPDWNKPRVVKLTPKTEWSRTWIDIFSNEEWSFETAEKIRYGWDCFVYTSAIALLSFFLLWGWDHRHRAFVLECRQRGTKPLWTRWEDYDLTPLFSWPFGQSKFQGASK